MASLEERDWNRIWCRIIKNSFSPNGFIGQVDFIVGNPPWVRWSRLPQLYRERVKLFCNYYGLVSGRDYSGGIETDISTVVLYSAVDHWLRGVGKVGILITWTVFKSGSARGFRLGALPNKSGIKMDLIADLRRIKQLFPDATNETSLLAATKVSASSAAELSQVAEETWVPKNSGRIDPLATLEDVLNDVSILDGVACPVSDWGSPLWTGNKRDFGEARFLRGSVRLLTIRTQEERFLTWLAFIGSKSRTVFA